MSIPNYTLYRAKCDFYEPLAETEGMCVPTQRIVSKCDGCDCPENCIELKRYLESIRK